MAGKRSATTELNHDNWDKEDEVEYRGTFKIASEDALKHRVIKTAKRRNPISSVRTEGEDTKNVFSNFKSFQSKPADFSFLNNLKKTADDCPNTNVTQSTSEEPKVQTTFSFNSSSNKSDTAAIKKADSKSDGYYAKLKGLNETVTKWIQSKVDENPMISLQPIFKDYEKYLEEIEDSERAKQLNAVDTSSIATFMFKSPDKSVPNNDSNASDIKKVASSAPHFTFGTPTTTSTTLNVGASSNLQFSFGSKTSATTAPTFSFGSTSSTSSGFSFVPSTPSTTNKNADSEEGTNNGEDEDSPPKVVFTPVVEKDHLFTIRCKVFVKKDGKFGDRGVGNLYIKPIDNSEKVQIIVRADTNLGNLLCNFVLSESIPLQRMGNKDVMLVCVPTPDIQPPPVPILLRVKSPEEADNLLKVLEKHKK